MDKKCYQTHNFVVSDLLNYTLEEWHFLRNIPSFLDPHARQLQPIPPIREVVCLLTLFVNWKKSETSQMFAPWSQALILSLLAKNKPTLQFSRVNATIQIHLSHCTLECKELFALSSHCQSYTYQQRKVHGPDEIILGADRHVWHKVPPPQVLVCDGAVVVPSDIRLPSVLSATAAARWLVEWHRI